MAGLIVFAGIARERTSAIQDAGQLVAQPCAAIHQKFPVCFGVVVSSPQK